MSAGAEDHATHDARRRSRAAAHERGRGAADGPDLTRPDHGPAGHGTAGSPLAGPRVPSPPPSPQRWCWWRSASTAASACSWWPPSVSSSWSGSAWWFLAVRGALRWLALALVVLTPLVVAWLFIRANLLWVALVVLVLVAAAGGLGKTALAREARPPGMPEHEFPPPQRPFVVMNPRSGGGKVTRFGLKEKAEALGAEVVLLEGPGHGRRRGAGA